MSSPGKCRAAVALLALGALCAGHSAAQPGSFLDSVDVNVVNVEVMVTDRDGVPVRGLRRENFTIWEDGQQAELSNFFAVVGGRVLPAAGAEDDLAALPMPDTRRLQLVLLVDELNIRPENRNRMLDELRAYIEPQRDTPDLMMLVRAGNEVVVEQPFTRDTSLVLEAIDRMEQRIGRHVEFALEHRSLLRKIQSVRLLTPAQLNPLAMQATVFEAERLGNEIRITAARRYRSVAQTVNLLERFTRTLAGIPGRKGILYVSDGLPVRTAEALIEAWRAKFESWLRVNGETGVVSRVLALNPLDFETSGVLRRLVAEANANRVAFYPISNTTRQTAFSLSAENRGDFSNRSQGPGSFFATEADSSALDESLLLLARGTGGIALTGRGRITGLIDRMREDFGSFYSLGYLRPEGEDLPYHRVEVRVASPELVVRHLQGFRQRDPLLHLQDLTLSALHYGLGRNPLEIGLEPGEQTPAARNRYVVSLTVTIPFRKLLLLPTQDRHVAELVLVVAARNEAGDVSRPRRIELPIRIPNERILDTADGLAVYPMQLEMRGGPQRISVGVRDQLARVDSTFTLDIEVGAPAAGSSSAAARSRRGRHDGAEPPAVVAAR